jgi:hypothetical protein
MPGSRPSLGRRPSNPAVPASVSPPKNFRRLMPPVCCRLLDISLPEAGQRDTWNTSQGTLLPSHEQAKHLTPLFGLVLAGETQKIGPYKSGPLCLLR